MIDIYANTREGSEMVYAKMPDGSYAPLLLSLVENSAHTVWRGVYSGLFEGTDAPVSLGEHMYSIINEEGHTVNPISVEDMAYELAEYDFLNAPIRYLLDAYTDQWQDDDDIEVALDKAWRELHKEWTRKPEAIIKASYADLTNSGWM